MHIKGLFTPNESEGESEKDQVKSMFGLALLKLFISTDAAEVKMKRGDPRNVLQFKP